MDSYEIFISYSRKDNLGKLLKEELQKIGYSVWIDQEFIDLGDDFEREIYDKITRCNYVVALLSESSYKSNWVKSELITAKSAGKKVFPILIDDSNPLKEYPLILADSQIVSVGNDMKLGAELVSKCIEKAFSSISNPEPITVFSDAPDIEGKTLGTEIVSNFIPRKHHNSEVFSQYYSRVSDDNDSLIPYHELYGSARKGSEEFVEGLNMVCSYEQWKPNLRPLIIDYDNKMEQERRNSEKAGYDPSVSIPRLTLVGVRERRNPLNGGGSTLFLTFGEGDYFEQRMFRERIEAEDQFASQFRRQLSVRGNNNKIDHELWGLCGGGTWVVTSDGYLAVSFRTNVTEVRGRLSYSASGGFDKYATSGKIGSPLQSMMTELSEELGFDTSLLDKEKHQLLLISLGIDIERFLIQFSYFWKCPLTRQSIYQQRNSGLCASPDEQMVFFVPFEKNSIASLLERYEIEPGAAFSLMRIMQKEFNWGFAS